MASRTYSSRSREEAKVLTRQALLRAALKLLSRNSFDSISLREVTKEAGISPTAFYRHFDDMTPTPVADPVRPCPRWSSATAANPASLSARAKRS